MANSKKTKKADAALAKAKEAVKAASDKLNSRSETQKKQDAYKAKLSEEQSKKAKPAVSISKSAKTGKKLYDGKVIDKAEYFKLHKGDFRVTAWSNGQKFDVPKRFKSCTRAQEWIAEHTA